jgi:hypothetical protein
MDYRVGMSMRPRVSVEIPAQTVAVVQAACPGGTRVTRVRDVLGPIFDPGTSLRVAGEHDNAVAFSAVSGRQVPSRRS